LIVTADFEFGVAMRMSGATAFPQPMAIGATGRELDAYQLGRITAIEARAIGVHWTFSPVADLNSNPDNPIINTRSFGETPGRVAPLISAYIRGASDYGLFTTAKHFPGHGDTGVDSHIALPVLAACWERLDSLELAPFRSAIAAGVTSIMTAHVALPCIDDGENLPATLSARIMRTVLGDSLGFRGIVVTDALTMGAIVSTYGIGESAVQAFLAGSDVLLYPSDPFEAFYATVAAVRSGRIPAERLDHSVRKLLNLKEQAGLFERRTVPLDSVTSFVGIRAHTLIAEDIAARSLTLVQEGALNAFRNRRSRVAVVTYAEETNLRIGNTMVRHLRDLGDTVSTFRIFPASGPLSYDSASVLIAQHGRVIFATSVRAVSGRGHIALPSLLADLIQRTNRATPTVLVSFGSPYLLRQIGAFDGTFILAWTDVDPAERAVAFALSGGAPITGQLPISLSPTMVRGHGITVPAENR
jgi:beta-glucosidase-like glycosyl hydrolase